MNRSLRAVAVLGLILAMSACSLDSEERSASTALANVIEPGNPSDYQQELAECTAQRWVGEVGLDRMREANLVTKNQNAVLPRASRVLSGNTAVRRDIAEAYARARYSCSDFDEAAQDAAKSFPDATEEQLDEYADCFKEMDSSLFINSTTQTLMGQPDSRATKLFNKQVQQCSTELP